ncbi:MAG: KUP/HAK/KT family potassium transporter, partial [Alphaproteobacteria bacterium]|nr:KUP/HAK/KT family potassium transporter [Alphaproteobacteria bacterium]
MTEADPLLAEDEQGPGHIHGSLAGLMLGATGVVFGDIGTSPLYALQATLDPRYHLNVSITNMYGLVSLIFWTFLFVVTLKYVFIVMRCDNHGEGGSLALFALIKRQLHHMQEVKWLMALALFATALFYSDSMLTPAISVISAVEGLDVVSTAFDPYIVGIALAILIGLFAIQSHGTDRVGKLFGPVMLVYFVSIGVMGLIHIIPHPEVLWALDPRNIYFFFAAHPFYSFLALGAVIYAVTGAEALYADMGHFGRKSITLAWLLIAFPMLIINYLGQAAMLLHNPKNVDNPFFHMVPHYMSWPLLILATFATIIASQAVISGAFSVTQQAIQLGFLPRLKIMHTSSKAEGQIYVPAVNWFLAVMVALLVIVFQHSAKMLPAYGLAVV